MSRILIVDDDLELADMLAEYLQAESFHMEHAADGEAGVRMAFTVTPAMTDAC